MKEDEKKPYLKLHSSKGSVFSTFCLEDKTLVGVASFSRLDSDLNNFFKNLDISIVDDKKTEY